MEVDMRIKPKIYTMGDPMFGEVKRVNRKGRVGRTSMIQMIGGEDDIKLDIPKEIDQW